MSTRKAGDRRASAGAGGSGSGGETPRVDRFALDVARTMVDMISRGIRDESESWGDRPAMMACQPHNIIYGTPYRGLNAVMLAVQAMRHGQSDLRFLTAGSLARLRDSRGEKARLLPGAPAYRVWAPYRLKPVRLDPDEDLSRYRPENLERRADGAVWYTNPRLYFTTRYVHSIADTTAVRPPLPPCAPAAAFERNEFFEAFLGACGTRIEHGGDEACFDMLHDLLRLPDRQRFVSSPEYYATLMHEYFHWTGGRRRENRIQAGGFASEAYAREELRAEIFSAMCSVMFGLDHLPRAADYIEKWNERLGSDPRSIYTAALDAQRVLAVVCDVADGRHPSPPWLAGADFSRVPTPFRDARLAGHDLENEWRRAMGVATRDADGREEQGAMEAVITYRRAGGSADAPSPRESVCLPTAIGRALAGELVKLVETSDSAGGFAPEDLGLGAIAPGGAAGCLHAIESIMLRSPGEGGHVPRPEGRAPATFEEWATAFMERDAAGWNEYDPSRVAPDLPAVYAGPGYEADPGTVAGRVRALVAGLAPTDGGRRESGEREAGPEPGERS